MMVRQLDRFRHVKINAILLLFLTLGCKENTNQNAIDQNIILVNYKFVDRNSIAVAINRINKCLPKVIGVNAIFRDFDPLSDSILVNAIGSTNNLVLVSTLKDDSIVRSNRAFTNLASSEGLLAFGTNDNMLKQYMAYKSIGNEILWSFPVTIVTRFDPVRGVDMLKKLQANTYYDIEFKRNMNSYLNIDINNIDNIDCSLFHDKIVLFGFLGPGDEDTSVTPLDNDQSRTYRVVVIANVISQLLEEFPN